MAILRKTGLFSSIVLVYALFISGTYCSLYTSVVHSFNSNHIKQCCSHARYQRLIPKTSLEINKILIFVSNIFLSLFLSLFLLLFIFIIQCLGRIVQVLLGIIRVPLRLRLKNTFPEILTPDLTPIDISTTTRHHIYSVRKKLILFIIHSYTGRVSEPKH